MRLPKTFNEFTVYQFQQWHKIIKEHVPDETFGNIQLEYSLLSLMLGISTEDCEAMKFSEVDPLIKQVNRLRFSKPGSKIRKVIMLGRKPYVAITNPSDLRKELNTNQLTAALTYAQSEDSIIENMHQLLALLYTPYRFMKPAKIPDNTELIADKLKQAKIGDVYGVVFFYSIVFKKLQESSSSYFQSQSQILTERMKEIAEAHGLSFPEATDGTTQSIG